MAKLTGDEERKLSAIAVRNIKPQERIRRLSDGHGMFVEIHPNGAKYWRFSYRFMGKQKTMALGVYPRVSLAEARRLHREAYNLLGSGVDPMRHKSQVREHKEKEEGLTFSKVADEWFELKINHKSSKTHIARTLGLLNNHINPHIGDIPFVSLTMRDVSSVLKRMEAAEILSSAHKARQILQQVIRFASASGYITTVLRVELTDGLEDAISPLGKTIQHFSAPTTVEQLAPILRTIDASGSGIVVKTAMQLTPILFTRPQELAGMKWKEINWVKKVWTIPASRMKAGREHMVPLPKQALELFQALHQVTGHHEYAFPSMRSKLTQHMSAESIRVGMRAAGISSEQATPHGFRATARTMLEEQEALGFKADIIEHQLAHAVRDATGRAYNRITFLNERHSMMQAWANFLDRVKSGAEVIELPVPQACDL